MILPLASLSGVLLGWLMAFLSLFLIMLILIQRGKGGGLTGALGGPGGQSAFGSKAGDTFTVITVVVASLWGLACIITMLVLGDAGGKATASDSQSNTEAVAEASEELEEVDAGSELVVPFTDTTTEESETDEDGEESDSATPSADLSPNDAEAADDSSSDSEAATDTEAEETDETAAEGAPAESASE